MSCNTSDALHEMKASRTQHAIGRGGVLRDQSNFDLAPAAARTPRPPARKGGSSPLRGTDGAQKRSPAGGAFAARQNGGQVVAALNEHLSFGSQARAPWLL